MSNSINNQIPFVPENTLDPAAGLNLALNTIDSLLQLAVITIGDDTPPGAPADGDRYIVGTAPTGDWTGQANKLARYVATGAFWQFSDAYLALNLADGIIYKFTSGSWSILTMAWTQLTDTPSSYTGLGGFTIKVNAAETGLEAVNQPTITSGTTAQRPATPAVADQHYDTDLGYPVWFNGTDWTDANGVIA